MSSNSNPTLDPQPGDEMQQAPWRCRVIRNDGWRVTYELYHDAWGWICSRTVTPDTWRAMAARVYGTNGEKIMKRKPCESSNCAPGTAVSGLECKSPSHRPAWFVLSSGKPTRLPARQR